MKTYGSKEMAIIPINYTDAKIKAESSFYSIRKFGFGNNNSFCTDFVHDVLLAGGINEIIVGGQNVIDISDIVSSADYRLEIRKILIDHNKNPDIMSYYSIEPRLHDLPLPVNIAPALNAEFFNYYHP
jgi:hypothetical protein